MKTLMTLCLMIGLYSCLFPNDPEFSTRTQYMSYAGILRWGNYLSSGRWADRKDVEHFLNLEKQINSSCKEAESHE